MSRPGNVHHDGSRARHEKRGLLMALRDLLAEKKPSISVYTLLTTSPQNARETREESALLRHFGLPKWRLLRRRQH